MTAKGEALPPTGGNTATAFLFACVFMLLACTASVAPISLGFVWGKPIPVRREPECTDEYVDEVHAAFIAAVEELFERNKERFGYPKEETLAMVSAKLGLH